MYLLRTGTRSVGSCKERMRRRLGGWGEVVGRGYHSGPFVPLWIWLSLTGISTMVVALFAACRAPKEGGGGEVEWRRRRKSVSIPEKAESHTQKKKTKRKKSGVVICAVVGGLRSAICMQDISMHMRGWLLSASSTSSGRSAPACTSRLEDDSHETPRPELLLPNP